MFLFLTDGKPSNDDLPIPELIEYINNQTITHPINLFTYGLGGDGTDNVVNQTLLRELSCLYDGVSFEIRKNANPSQLINSMREYYVFLSHGVTLSRPIWTEPYTDAFI